MGDDLRQMMGGALRPGDPRRWLIEAMIGAMIADGSLDDRELAVLRRQLEEQDLFAGLGTRAVEALIDIGQDAHEFAGGGARRVGMIARNLYTRTHRLAAYAMACEVCAADGFIADGEVLYLENLREHLHVFDNEAYQLLDAARAQQAMPALEYKMSRLRALVPALIDCFALKAIHEQHTDVAHQQGITAMLSGLSDVNVADAYINQQVKRAFRGADERARSLQHHIGMLGMEIPEVADRFWVMVYLIISELAAGNPIWYANEFLRALHNVFQLNGALMEKATATASLFPQAQP
jgi:uncharacterized tellurite resistance protein B-like protein